LIGKKRGQVALKEVLEAFSEEAKADVNDQASATDEVLIKNGTPAEVIVETAKKLSCDLIVMGTHGHSAIADALIGSTAKWVVRQSPIPVLVVRLP
jgi:nucleotide-binding universal stress UspA family protein